MGRPGQWNCIFSSFISLFATLVGLSWSTRLHTGRSVIKRKYFISSVPSSHPEPVLGQQKHVYFSQLVSKLIAFSHPCDTCHCFHFFFYFYFIYIFITYLHKRSVGLVGLLVAFQSSASQIWRIIFCSYSRTWLTFARIPWWSSRSVPPIAFCIPCISTRFDFHVW